MLNYQLFREFFHSNDHWTIIYVLMLIYHEYYRIQNKDLQLMLKDDCKYDESIVLHDEKILTPKRFPGVRESSIKANFNVIYIQRPRMWGVVRGAPPPPHEWKFWNF
jgi:hypothetical protein